MEALTASGSRNHADTVYELTNSAVIAQSSIAASWRRSLTYHGLQPDSDRRHEAITPAELSIARSQLGALPCLAEATIEKLFTAVGDNGCCVILTDADGVICKLWCQPGDREAFAVAGLRSGAHWGEAFEGTNGIGTCLAEKKPVIVHRNQHFHTRNIDMSCIDAPIFNHHGRLLAALDVSSCRSDCVDGVLRIIAMAVGQAAREIETRLFQSAFAGARIVVADPSAKGGPVLFAVDRDDLIIGATRAARRMFDLDDDAFDLPRPADDVLAGRRQRSDISAAVRAEVQRALARSNGNVSQAARDLGIGRATMYRRMKTLSLT